MATPPAVGDSSTADSVLGDVATGRPQPATRPLGVGADVAATENATNDRGRSKSPKQRHIKYGDKYLMHYQGRIESITHMYSRRFGFARQHQEAIDANERAVRAHRAADQKVESAERSENFSLFERYILAKHPLEEYAISLDGMFQRLTATESFEAPLEKLEFKEPPSWLVYTYVYDMRYPMGDDNGDGSREAANAEKGVKHGTLKKHLAAISGTCNEFGGSVWCTRTAVSYRARRSIRGFADEGAATSRVRPDCAWL